MTDTADMQGKTVLITGGTSGVGQVSARELARRGARIVLIARDRSRTDSELEALEAIAPGGGACRLFRGSLFDARCPSCRRRNRGS